MNAPAPGPVGSRRRFLRIVAGPAFALLAGGGRSLLRAAGEPELVPVTWRGIALGAEVAIEVHHHDEAPARAALRDCVTELRRLENIFSLYDARSAVGRLNRDGRLQSAPPEFVELLALGREFSDFTAGAFDLTIQPVCELLAARGATVTDAEIAAALARVDYRAVEIADDNVRFTRPDMRITCNGIAQGFITDRIADRLQAAGFSHTLIDLGEKRALGSHPTGRAWRLGVEAPDARGELIGAVDLTDRAFATSGGYGHVYQPGRRHHLLDARSGLSRHQFASISVVAPRAATADALSTCFAVMDPAWMPDVLARFPDVEVYVVTAATGQFERYSS